MKNTAGYDMSVSECIAVADKMVRYAEIARLDGILALEDSVETENDEFVKEGLSLLINGENADEIEKKLGSLTEKKNLPDSCLFYKLIIRACTHIAQGQNPKIVQRDLYAMIEPEKTVPAV